MNRKVLMMVAATLLAAIAVVGQPPGTGQNKFCEEAFPFCTGTLYNFPAGVNAGSGQPGPCYSCLTTRPNPAWYFMKVLDPGSIIIYMHSVPSEDIDFCCWGPFDSQDCCDLLTCNKVVDCSYSPLPYETVNINNAQAGQYYMLVITNFSNNPCNIIFEQTGGNGTTDCSILPPAATSNSPICAGQTLLLSAQTVANAIYHWTGPDGFESDQQNPTIPDAQPVNAGTYYLTITLNGQTSDSSLTVACIYEPEANAGNDTSIANGLYTTLHGSCTGGSGSYSWHWEPADKLVNPDVQHPQTVNLFATTVFTLQVTDDSASCQSSDPVTVNVVGGVLAVNALATPSSVCAGTSSQLEAFGSGGSGAYTYQWTGPGGFISSIQNPVVQPAATSTYTVYINDGYNTASNTVTVTVVPLPVADAGPDDTIPYGTYTFLTGSVGGASGNCLYSWQPSALLVNPNVQFPQTANLTSTTVYALTVTDMTTNCVSSNPADAAILVTGGPLNVNPSASQPWICAGETTQLYASAGGGDTLGYQYTWSSNPPGFSSAEANPLVSPVVNTTYTVVVTDGFNTVTGSASVSIYPQPVIHLGPPDSTVCVYDTITLDAGNPGSAYLWSDGSSTQKILVGSTGIGFDVQSYTVQVTNASGCTAGGSINVIFSFQACTGIGEEDPSFTVTIWPNPAHNVLWFSMPFADGETTIRILNLLGEEVFTTVTDGKAWSGGAREILLPLLPEGTYLIRFTHENRNVIKKLVIH